MRLSRPSIAATAFYTYAAVLVCAFLFAWSGRHAVFLSYAAHDDALFVRLGEALRNGHWLGPYDEKTLIKGAGFPFFLALASLLRINVITAEALAYVGAAVLFVCAARQFSLSKLLSAILLTALLCLPVFAQIDQTRITREFFYTSLTLAFAGLLVPLLCSRPHISTMICAGLVGGWAWVTREEGLWLLPIPAVIVLGVWFFKRWSADRRFGMAIAVAVLAGVSVPLCISAINRVVYGEFLSNEITQGAYPDALTAMERGAYPFWKHRIPVPREARAALYNVSPTLAILRPYLDPTGPTPNVWTAFGCQLDTTTCGDIAGGWFLWSVRDAAVNQAHVAQNARQARSFYRQMAAEINTACASGRLTCATWIPKLMPPLMWGDLPHLLASAEKMFPFFTLGIPVAPLDSKGYLDPSVTARWLAFLHSPAREDEAAFPRVWRVQTAALQPAYHLGIMLGIFALAFNILWEIGHRKPSAITIFSTACVAGVGLRYTLFALIDALSYPAANYGYTEPAIPLLVVISILGIWQATGRVRTSYHLSWSAARRSSRS